MLQILQTHRRLMNDPSLTRQTMIEKISVLERRNRELERMESEHKRVKEALQKSEERYRQWVDNVYDIVFRTDCEGRFTFVNPAVLRITGYREEEIVGRHYPTFIHPDMRQEAIRFFTDQRINEIQNAYYECRIVAKDGREVWLGQNVWLIREQGLVVGFQSVSRDITDRKRIERELRDSEDRYRRIIESSSDAILLRRMDTIIYANPAAIRLFRATGPEALLGKRYLDLVHPEDRAVSAARVKKSQEENWIAFPREHRLLTMDGQTVHVESTGVPLQYRGERHVFGIFRDLSERKQAEVRLRQQTDAMEAAIDGMAILNEQGEYAYLNRAHAEIYGYDSAEELIGKSWKTLYDDEELRRFARDIMPALGRKGRWHGEARGLKKDGTRFPQELSLTVLSDGGLVCVIQDITRRKMAEELLEAERTLLKSMIDTVPDRIYAKDKLGRFIVCNEAMVRRMGKTTMAEIVGKSDIDLLPKELAERFHSDEQTIIRTGTPLINSEEPLEIVDGRVTRWNLATKVPLLDKDGNRIGIVGVGREITDLKMAQEALKDSEKKYRELSIMDDLTQLYNARYFYHQLKSEIDRANRYQQPLSLMLLDLDDFKAFNDAYGHIEGDRVLMRLGRVVKNCLRQTDSAYRYGGEEFTVLLPMTNLAEGVVTAERVRTAFGREIFSPVPGKEVRLTLSIGVGRYRPLEAMRDFVHRVDLLMYSGKKNGKDRVCSEMQPPSR